jgi:hypothetical protein
MSRAAPRTPPIGAGFFVGAALPFIIPMLVTMALVLTVGEAWPRQIAPGSGLKLAGLVAAGLTGLAVFAALTFRHSDARLRKGAALLCAITSLMGWPVWSIGVLPSVNGSALGPPEAAAMVLERTEVTTVSRSNSLNHWAWLRPLSAGAPVEAGRFFIPQDLHARWSANPPDRVTLTVARGRLGAVVVTGFE